VVAATGAVGSHACSYSFITRRTQHSTSKKDNSGTVYVQGRETVCVNMLSLVMLFVGSFVVNDAKLSRHGNSLACRPTYVFLIYT